MSLKVSLGLNLVTSQHFAGRLVQVSWIHSVGVLGVNRRHDGLAEILRALVGLLAHDSLRSVWVRVLGHLHLDWVSVGKRLSNGSYLLETPMELEFFRRCNVHDLANLSWWEGRWVHSFELDLRTLHSEHFSSDQALHLLLILRVKFLSCLFLHLLFDCCVLIALQIRQCLKISHAVIITIVHQILCLSRRLDWLFVLGGNLLL